MKHTLIALTLFAGAAAFGEELYFSPANPPTNTSTNNQKFGFCVYTGENWKTAAGENQTPADGDVLVYKSGGQMTGMNHLNQDLAAPPAAKLGGFVYDGRVQAVSQGLMHLQGGGRGLVITNCSNATASWYCGANVYGSDEIPFSVANGCTWGMQRYFWQTDGGAATIVKRGGEPCNSPTAAAGRVACAARGRRRALRKACSSSTSRAPVENPSTTRRCSRRTMS